MRSTVGLLILLLSGCSYYFEQDDEPPADDGDDSDGDDDGGVDVDGGPVDPDAGGPCDPVAILPDGFHPVAEVSSGAVTNQAGPMPDEFTTVVDASAGGAAGQATQPFLYLDLEGEGGAAAVPIDDPASFASTDWDLALKRFVIRSNSGDSGPADGEVATVQSEELTFDNEVPSQLFSDDDWSEGAMADCTLVRDATGGPRTRFSNWYEVTGGRFEPRAVVHLVRLGGGRYAEVDVVTYYGDEAAPDRSGVYVLHWRRFP